MSSIDVHSPRGNPVIIHHREGTSDLATIGSTFRLWGKMDDEYGLADLPPMSGTAIDVGAHVGSVAFALLADHPDLRVIAVEPLAENCEMLRLTAAENGWTDRIDIRHAAIAKGKSASVAYDFRGDDYLQNHRYIGGMEAGVKVPHATETVPALRLRDLVGDDSPFLKVDCEGCEFTLLDDPAIAKVERIVGEGHPKDWLARIHKLLDATHDVEVIDDRGGPGTFRAVRR